MNSLVGKSTGIALLMTAALHRCPLRHGRLRPRGRQRCDLRRVHRNGDGYAPDPEAETELVIVFQLLDNLDGIGGDEDVTITIPLVQQLNSALRKKTLRPTVSVTQRGIAGGDELGDVDVELNSDDDVVITIGPSADADTDVVGDRPVTVVINGLKNPATGAVGGATIAQSSVTASVSAEIYAGIVGSVTLSSEVPGATGVDMTIVFTPGETAAVTITLPDEYELFTGPTATRNDRTSTTRWCPNRSRNHLPRCYQCDHCGRWYYRAGYHHSHWRPGNWNPSHDNNRPRPHPGRRRRS